MGALIGKTAVVTGGTTGLGYAAAKRFAEEGARVIVTGQDEGRVFEAAASLGHGVLGVRADVRQLADLDALAALVKSELGGLDVLFVNAGVGTFVPIAQTVEELYDLQFDVNVKGAYFTVQRLLGQLRPGASVIFNASAVHEKGLPGASVYSATKAAVRSIARTLAAELGPSGIRVNSLSPGYVPTPFLEKTGLPPEALDELVQHIRQVTPLGRAGRAEEIAGAAVFLASDEAAFITGADLLADGGFASV